MTIGLGPEKAVLGDARRRGLSGSLGACCLGVASLGAAALGCGDRDRAAPLGSPRPIAGCEGFSYRPCDIMTEPCQRELFALMACLHGDPSESEPPPVRLLDEASALTLVSGDAAMSEMTDAFDPMQDMAGDERAFRAEVRALELLGMLSPGLIEAPADVAEVTISNLVAYYYIPTREIVIIDRGDPVTDVEANAVLAHELVHALQDRRYGLATFGVDVAADADGTLAVGSLIEGEATLYQYLVTFSYRGADLRYFNFPGFFNDLVLYGEDATLQAGSPAITASGIFPYTLGTRYAGEIWLLGGADALEAQFQAPPRSSWEVIQNRPPAANVERFEQSPAPLDGSTLLAEDVAGAWVVAAALGSAGMNVLDESLSELGGHWRGDHYWVFASADETPAVTALWAIEWDAPPNPERFAALGAALAPAGAALRLETEGTTTRITATERAEELDAWHERLAEATALGP